GERVRPNAFGFWTRAQMRTAAPPSGRVDDGPRSRSSERRPSAAWKRGGSTRINWETVAQPAKRRATASSRYGLRITLMACSGVDAKLRPPTRRRQTNPLPMSDPDVVAHCVPGSLRTRPSRRTWIVTEENHGGSHSPRRSPPHRPTPSHRASPCPGRRPGGRDSRRGAGPATGGRSRRGRGARRHRQGHHRHDASTAEKRRTVRNPASEHFAAGARPVPPRRVGDRRRLHGLGGRRPRARALGRGRPRRGGPLAAAGARSVRVRSGARLPVDRLPQRLGRLPPGDTRATDGREVRIPPAPREPRRPPHRAVRARIPAPPDDVGAPGVHRPRGGAGGRRSGARDRLPAVPAQRRGVRDVALLQRCRERGGSLPGLDLPSPPSEPGTTVLAVQLAPGGDLRPPAPRPGRSVRADDHGLGVVRGVGDPAQQLEHPGIDLPPLLVRRRDLRRRDAGRGAAPGDPHHASDDPVLRGVWIERRPPPATGGGDPQRAGAPLTTSRTRSRAASGARRARFWLVNLGSSVTSRRSAIPAGTDGSGSPGLRSSTSAMTSPLRGPRNTSTSQRSITYRTFSTCRSPAISKSFSPLSSSTTTSTSSRTRPRPALMV